jgi:hypothetical protein
MNKAYYPLKRNYISIAREGIHQSVESMLYEPVEPDEKSQIAVILIHPGNNSLERPGSVALAERGYRALSASVINPDGPLDQKLLDVKVTIEYLRQYPGVKKVILLGHSGGATLMSAYQKAAENGVQALQGPEKLIKCSDLGKLPPADGIMHLDSNYGNGIMTLFSLDPAVTNEDSGRLLNSEYDLFDPANGYSPNGSIYSEEFIRKYQKAQGERSNRLIDAALERLHAIENGKGKYIDDEPFIVPAGALNAYNNKLLPQDIRLLSRTQKAWPLIHADGTITTQIIPCVRRAKNKHSLSNSYHFGAIKSTVRTYLNSSAVRTTEDYGYNEDSLFGIEWSSSYNCTPGNMMDVSAPLLVMGMTGGYEFLAAEIIYEKAEKAKDKTIAFVEGATHVFTTAKNCEAYPGQFGDTVKTLFDYVDLWLSEKGRFID